MDANDDFYGKELNLNCFYMHTIFGQKYPKPTIVKYLVMLGLVLMIKEVQWLTQVVELN